MTYTPPKKECEHDIDHLWNFDKERNLYVCLKCGATKN